MKLLTKNLNSRIFSILCRRCSTEPTYVYPSKNEDYTERPQYPPMDKNDLLPEETKIENEWHDKIKRQQTVEEKLFEVNVPRYFGWKCFMVREGVIPFDNLRFAQHMTRTHLVECENLPEYYDKYTEASSRLLGEIKNHVIDAIEYQLNVRHQNIFKASNSDIKEEEQLKIIITELNRVLTNSLWTDVPHLQSIQTDYSPRIEASWKINSLVETFVKKKYPYGLPEEEIPEEYLDRPSDKYVQYIGNPLIQLRHELPLPQLMERLEANIFGYSVPVYEYDPHVTLGYEMERRHATNIPGFWPGDNREFSFLSYHSSNHIKNRPPTYGEVDAKESLQSQAIFASFGWLMPLACYQGFSSYHDLTYPLVTQTVLTDGQRFTLAVYQMNTTEMYHKYAFENPQCNICWITPTMSLFETCENGKLRGFNDEVLLRLIKLYLNTPKALTNCELKPYLGKEVCHVADYEDEEKREWLEKKYKLVCTNMLLGREDELYEVYDWERIYKIQFRLLPRHARKRPFEMRQNPYHRKMSEERGKYIPKHLRPDKDLPKWRQRKFKKTFYPE